MLKPISRFFVVGSLSVLSILSAAAVSHHQFARAHGGRTPAVHTRQSGTNEVRAGEAKGTFTVGSKTVQLKYAYAVAYQSKFPGQGQVIYLILTETPLPEDVLANERKFRTEGSDTLLLDMAKGLVYHLRKNGYVLQFHPGDYQVDSDTPIKEFSIENGIVRGRDESKGKTSGVQYSRAVSFSAPLPKQKQ